jgi:hypothetical protein
LLKKLPFKDFTPASYQKKVMSDRDQYGKGHGFATRVDELSSQIKFGRTFDATAESLAWALSLVMGSVSTTGPASLIYTHTLGWVDSTVQKECLYTSIIEKAGAEFEKLLSGVFIESVQITGEGKNNLQLAVTASARKQTDTTQVMPTLTLSPTFRTTFATFTFGATGAQTSQGESVTKWNLSLAQNPDVRWAPGQTSGDEKFLRYALIGNQAVSGSISFFLSNTLRELFLTHAKCGLTITNLAVGNPLHQMIIEIPAFYGASEAIAVSGQTTELTLNFTEDTVVKDENVAGSPIKVTLKNEIVALLS